jgi:hypothetical protein
MYCIVIQGLNDTVSPQSLVWFLKRFLKLKKIHKIILIQGTFMSNKASKKKFLALTLANKIRMKWQTKV